MASFDENGKYIKTNWKAGDKITATKLNKIEESIEAVNDNDISRHVEADARLDALEAKDVAHDKEFTNVKNLIADNKAAAELGDYEINSRMQFLEDDVEQAVNDMNNAVTTIRNEMNAHTNTVNTNVNNKISAFETEFDAEVAGLKAVDETIQNDVSEIQNDMESPQTQTFAVTDAYKFAVDHDGMVSSLVTLNNVEGLSSVETNNANQKFLVNNIVHDICTIDIGTINYFDYSSSTEIFGNVLYDIIDKSITITGDNSQGWSGVKFNLDNLTEGKRYCLFCDNVIVNSGGSGIEIVDGEINSLPSCFLHNFPEQSANSIVFTARANTIGIGLFCTAISGNTPTQGNVTYENIQIYEVKEMIVPDIQLSGLPNGVCDEIKDGVYIKRVSDPIRLEWFSWQASSMNQWASSTNNYLVYYVPVSDLAIAPSQDVITNQTLCTALPNVSYADTNTLESSGLYGVSQHTGQGELRIKVPKAECPDVASLRTWLKNNDVTIIYELNEPVYKDVNTTIKADKGDTVVINTTKTMDLTYDIQCNTRAQIDVLQETVVHTANEITSELRDSIDDLKYELDYDQYGNGYYILPGGLMIQFGYITLPANLLSSETYDTVIPFPVPFPNQVISVITSMSGGDNGWDSRVSGHATSNSHARMVVRGLNYTITNTMFWLAIGR